MSIFSAFDISGSGMAAQRTRLEVILSNMANAQTVRTPEGGPYRRRDVVLLAETVDDFRQYLQGVLVGEVVEDGAPFIRRYEPGHPEADKDGYVLYPNVNPVEEMTNLIAASRSFEANVAAMNSVKEMMMKALELGR